MKARHALLALLLLLLCAPLRAQETVRLAETFDRSGSVADANRFLAYLDGEEFTDEKIHFDSSAAPDSVRRTVWYWAGEWFNEAQDYPRARRYALRALPLFRHADAERGDCLNLLAIICVRLADFPSAAKYATECVRIDVRLGDPDKVSSSLNTLAGIHLAAGQPREAAQRIGEALRYAARADNPKRRAVLNGMASEIYYKLADYPCALAYARTAFRLDSARADEGKMAIRLSEQAAALAGMERHAEAERTYRRAIPMLRRAGNAHSEAIDLNQLGFVLIKLRREREAVGCFRRAAELLAPMGDLYNRCHSLRGLYEAYWTLSPDSARMELERFHALRDSLYSTATATALGRYEAEFGNDRLREELSDRRHMRRRDLCLAAVAFAVLAVGGVWVHRRRVRAYRRELRRLCLEVERLESAPTAPASGGERGAGEQSAAEALGLRHQVVEAVRAGMAGGDISVGSIAARLNMGEQTFRRRFVEETGRQPKMFITAIQMEHAARQLLRDPSRPVGEVARQCGFDEASAFSHAFRKAYGCSPSQYRLSGGALPGDKA